MARAVAEKQNGRWLVLVDVSNYGGEELSIAGAISFKRDLEDAISEAQRGNAQQVAMRRGLEG